MDHKDEQICQIDVQAASLPQQDSKTPRMARIWSTIVLLVDLSLRLFDTGSDLGVAYEYWSNGDVVWFSISIAILGVSSLRMFYIAAEEASKWNTNKPKWANPKLWWEGALGFLNLRPLVCVVHLLIVTKGDPTSSAAFHDLRILEEERFAEGLFETMSQLFLQSYVFFVKAEKGDAEAISTLSIFSVVISVICMAKTLLERFPSRARALSYINMSLMYLFILCGVISRCIAVISSSIFIPGGFLIIFAIELLFIFLMHSSLIDWHHIFANFLSSSKSKVTPYSPLSRQSESNVGLSGGSTKLTPYETAVHRLKTAVRSSFLTVFVYCPLTIAEQTCTIDLELETLSLVTLLWMHSALGVGLIAAKPSPYSAGLGYAMCACVGLQCLFLIVHNQTIFKIIRISHDFISTLPHGGNIPEKVPGEVDINFVLNDESVLMALAKLESALEDPMPEVSAAATKLCTDVLERGASMLYENSMGQTILSVASPRLQHVLMQCVLEEESGVTFNHGELVLRSDDCWLHIEPYIERGLYVTSFFQPGMTKPFSFHNTFEWSQMSQEIRQGFDPACMQRLFKCLEGSHTVHTVDLTGAKLSHDHCKILGSALFASHYIKTVVLKNCFFSSSFSSLLFGVAANQSIVSADLSNIGLANDRLIDFLNALGSNTALRILDLSKNLLSDSDQDPTFSLALTSFFTKNMTLVSLNLSGNKKLCNAKTVKLVEGVAKTQTRTCVIDWSDTPAQFNVSLQDRAELVVNNARLGRDAAEDLLNAFINKESFITREVVSAGFLNHQDPNGKSALLLACERLMCAPSGDHPPIANQNEILTNVICEMCELGADCSLCDEEGVNALGLACHSSNAVLTQTLLRSHQPTSTATTLNLQPQSEADGSDPLQRSLTAAWRHPKWKTWVVRALMLAGAKVEPDMVEKCLVPWLWDIVKSVETSGNVKELLKEAGFYLVVGEVSKAGLIDSQDAQNRSALLIAVDRGVSDAVECLCALGADSCVPDHEGISAFGLACSKAREDYVQAMLASPSNSGNHNSEISASASAPAAPTMLIQRALRLAWNHPKRKVWIVRPLLNRGGVVEESMISECVATSDPYSWEVAVLHAACKDPRLAPKHRDYSSITSVPFLSLSYPFDRSYGVAADPTSPLIFVADDNAHKIFAFDSNSGELIRSIGGKGRGLGLFNSPKGVAVSASGTLFVSDHDNHRVHAFDREGKAKFFFGVFGTGPGQLCHPLGLAVDFVRKHVYVCDSYNHRVCIFSEEDGKFLFSFGSEGSEPGQLREPVGVCVDGEKNVVCVGDMWNARVSMFNTSGEFIMHVGHENSGDPRGKLSRDFAKFVAIDSVSGHVLVTDCNTKEVHVFTKDGEWVGGFGGQDLFSFLRGMCVDPQGRVFVCCGKDGVYTVKGF